MKQLNELNTTTFTTQQLSALQILTVEERAVFDSFPVIKQLELAELAVNRQEWMKKNKIYERIELGRKLINKL